MHIFVSDLHLMDTPEPGTVSDAELSRFVEALGERAVQTKSKIRLIFVGDILELLRSPKWEDLWSKHKSAPWSGMSKNFSNFSNNYSEACAIEIARSIRSKYQNFSSSLKKLVEAQHLESNYVFGNHDYMVQLSTGLREIVADFLALNHDPKKRFELSYSDGDAAVFATHGHGADPVNWHREAEGFWAVGDAVVLRIVNRFATLACSEIGCSPDTKIGRQLQEIDNIEPLSDIPIYIRWLAEECLATKGERKKIERAWKQVVEDFLSIGEFRDQGGYAGTPYENLRTAFSLSTHLDLSQLISRLAAMFPAGGPDYRGAAMRQLSGSSKYRFVLFGHTHNPMLVPLWVRGEETLFYVNTGCWRRLMTRVLENAGGPFVARRVSSRFEVDAPNEAAPERFHLYQEWHAT